MKKEDEKQNFRKRLFAGRAAQIIAVTATVFLCFMTIFEYVALRMEWNIPVLQVVTGDSDSYVFKGYRQEEMQLDKSTENILLTEIEGEHKQEEIEEREQTESRQEDFGVKQDEETETSNENSEEEQQDAVTEKVEADTSGETEDVEEFPYYIKVNRQQNCVTIYTPDENGEYTIPYKAMVCSTGLYNATPTGTYHLSTKYLWRELYGGVYGQYATRITGGVLFHSVPYYRRSKNALCTEKYNKLGQQASMGCIRLTVEDAKWIAENCPQGTAVEIYDDKENAGELGKPQAMIIDTDNPNKGWDPTDPDIENPWHQVSEDN